MTAIAVIAGAFALLFSANFVNYYKEEERGYDGKDDKAEN